MFAFVFNTSMRSNSEGLKACMDKGQTYGFYVGTNLSDFVLDTLYFLDQKLKLLGVPLYIVSNLPDKITEVYTYSRLEFNIPTMYFKDYFTTNKPYRVISYYYDQVIKTIDYKKETMGTQELKILDLIIPSKRTNNPYIKLSKLLQLITNHLFSGKEIKRTYLSNFINHGLVDPKGLVYMIKRKAPDDIFLLKLLRRDFYYNSNLEFEDKGEKNEEAFKRWTLGQTNVPNINALMLKAQTTGYLDWRGRALLAHFWCRQYGGSWMMGDKYFSTIFRDYDPILSKGGWLWASGQMDTAKNRTMDYTKN
jgi:deoxyribodipyrimidine photolyase